MRVAILDDYQDAALASADWGALPDTTVEAFRDHIDDQDALVARLQDFDAIVLMRERTPFPRSLIERLPTLRLLVTTGARNAAIDVAAAREHGVTVCGTRSLPTPTAELTWGLIFALARHIPAEDRALREGRWQTTLGTGLHSKTLGVIGLGNLGGQVARVGVAFGMNVLAWSQNLTAERASEAGATLVPKDELLARSDIVTVHLVLSDRTRGLIGAPELALMRPTAVLVNTSRGPIVDERALAAALEARAIAGAAVDVYDAEPLAAEHPFRRLDNLLLTPHIGYVTREGYQLFYGDAADDIHAYLNGTPVRVIEL
jgi:phosphoglycerate dehydrogenase-like enzyme